VQIREENKAVRLKQPIERRIFPEGKDEIGKGGGLPYKEMRWSRFRNKGQRICPSTVVPT
jgi:type I restriction enzyme M protein